jgi:hypothetical protein
MKKYIFLTTFITTMVVNTIKSQNTYDPYRTGNGGCTYEAMGSPDVNGGAFDNITEPGPPYNGEYQIFFNGDHPANYWNSLMATHAITYKIEVVSFPFTTNCFNCQGNQTFAINSESGFGPTLPSNIRTLLMPNNQFPYSASSNAWVRNLSDPAFTATFSPPFSAPPAPASTTYNLELKRIYEGVYPNGFGGSDPSTLISRCLTLSDPYEYHVPDRILYPHTVLKHTIYIHANTSITSPVLDSYSFVLDHTRGRMSYYPFVNTYTTPATEVDHDISIYPTFLMPTNWETNPNYMNNDLIAPGINNTINYFPLPLINDATVGYMPAGNEIIAGAPSASFIRPAPFSLIQAFLANEDGTVAAGFDESTLTNLPGVKHNYVIDQPIDLTLINPDEKIIYNPSDVAIDLTQPSNLTGNTSLVFPSGYTFQTVNGIYPSTTQVQNGDLQNLYSHSQNIISENTLEPACDDVEASLDNYFSYYRVKSGSTLIIEPCVRLYDVLIIAENGSEIFYNLQEISGHHFDIIAEPGGILHNANHPVASAANCPFNCYNVAKFDIIDHHNVVTNRTWTTSNIVAELDANLDGRIEIGAPIYIKPGVTLTIDPGVQLFFGENGKIVVEEGATLIANGTVGSEVVFTTLEFCDKGMWGGIQVLGNATLPQGTIASPLTNQGYLILNHAIVENARTGVYTGKSGTTVFNGGLINISQCTFRNNFTDVEINPYSSGTLSYAAHIGNSTFETTQKLRDPYYVSASNRPIACDKHIFLNGVKYVEFDANTFQNTAVDGLGQPFFDAHVRGTGIYAVDADLTLADGSSANTFSGLSNGFWGLKTAGNLPYIQIRGNHFYNNVRGIILEGTQYTSVYTNDFTIPASSANSIIPGTESKGYNKPVGLYLVSATDFNVEENTFFNYGTPTTSGISSDLYNYGIVVNNSKGSTSPDDPFYIGSDGVGTGYIYKNQFSFSNMNLQAELDNLGLEYKCNIFGNDVNNFVNVVDAPLSSGLFPSLLGSQGLCGATVVNATAGNLYGDCSLENQLHFDLLSAGAPENASFVYADILYALDCYTNIWSGMRDICSFSEANTCPSQLFKCHTVLCLQTAYTNAQTLSAEVSTSIAQLIDGGNTAGLISKINSNITSGELKNLLMTYSPYLSDAVLIAMLDRTNPLPVGHVKQIIIENSPITKQVMDVVESKNLPAGIMTSIEAAQTGISPRMEKEKEATYYSFQAKRAGVELIQEYLIENNLAGVKDVVDDDKSLNGLYSLMEVLLEMQDYTGAKVCLANIQTAEGATKTDRTRLLEIAFYLAQNNLTWAGVTETQLKTISKVYSNNPLTAVQARAILANVAGMQYDLSPYGGNSNNTKSMQQIENTEKATPVTTFNVFPNPANNQLTVSYQLNTGETAQFELYDLLGSKIMQTALSGESTQKQLDINTVNAGVYLYVYKINNRIVKTERLVILK